VVVLASVLASWAHSLTCREGGDVWFQEFAIAYLRADRRGRSFRFLHFQGDAKRHMRNFPRRRGGT
jgi:hypothetical protein